MLLTPSWLVLVRDNGLICIPTCPVPPHKAIALRRLSQLVEDLQDGFIRMEEFSLEQFHMQR